MKKQYVYSKVTVGTKDQPKHTQLVIYIQNPPTARKERLIPSSYNQLLDHVVHLRVPAESKDVSLHSANQSNSTITYSFLPFSACSHI